MRLWGINKLWTYVSRKHKTTFQFISCSTCLEENSLFEKCRQLCVNGAYLNISLAVESILSLYHSEGVEIDLSFFCCCTERFRIIACSPTACPCSPIFDVKAIHFHQGRNELNRFAFKTTAHIADLFRKRRTQQIFVFQHFSTKIAG